MDGLGLLRSTPTAAAFSLYGKSLPTTALQAVEAAAEDLAAAIGLPHALVAPLKLTQPDDCISSNDVSSAVECMLLLLQPHSNAAVLEGALRLLYELFRYAWTNRGPAWPFFGPFFCPLAASVAALIGHPSGAVMVGACGTVGEIAMVEVVATQLIRSGVFPLLRNILGSNNFMTLMTGGFAAASVLPFAMHDSCASHMIANSVLVDLVAPLRTGLQVNGVMLQIKLSHAIYLIFRALLRCDLEDAPGEIAKAGALPALIYLSVNDLSSDASSVLAELALKGTREGYVRGSPRQQQKRHLAALSGLTADMAAYPLEILERLLTHPSERVVEETFKIARSMTFVEPGAEAFHPPLPTVKRDWGPIAEQETATYANLAASKNFLESLWDTPDNKIGKDFILSMLQMVKGAPPIMMQHAARALAYAVYRKIECRDVLVRAGAVSALKNALDHSSADVVEQAAGALRALFHWPSPCSVSAPVMGPLVKLLGHSSPGVVEHAAGALRAAVLFNAPCCSIAVRAGAVKPLAGLLQYASVGVIEQAAGALANLAMGDDTCKEDVFACGALSLMALLRHPDEGVRQAAERVDWIFRGANVSTCRLTN